MIYFINFFFDKDVLHKTFTISKHLQLLIYKLNKNIVETRSTAINQLLQHKCVMKRARKLSDFHGEVQIYT